MLKWAKLREGPYRNVLPDREETALLKLVHADPFDQDICRKWLDRTDLNTAHDGILRLMPLLHTRMQNAGLNHAESARLAGIYRHTRFRNRILLHRGGKLVAALAQLGIPCLLLKGASIVLHPDADPGTRPMADFDLLVPEDTDLTDLFERLGPHLDFRLEAREVAPTGVTYVDDSGLEYDLHTHLRYKTRFAGSTAAYWQDAQPLMIGDIGTRGLSCEHFVFHTILHGLEYNPVSPSRWVADVLFALDIAKQFDWHRLFQHAYDNAALEIALVGASYLIDEGFAVNRIEQPFEHWAVVREPWWIVRHHRFRTAPFNPSRLSLSKRFLLFYLLRARLEGHGPSLSHFTSYVRDHYGAKAGTGALFRLIWRAMFAGRARSRKI